MNKLNASIKVNRRDSVVQKRANISDKRETENISKKTKNDKVSLSQTSKLKASISGKNDIASDVRFELINKYREILNNGTYVVKAEELADKIVQKIRENKNRMVI